MSCPPQVVLLDSNAYFRLALSIHPLLGAVFGTSPPFSLFVLDVLNREFASSMRLQNRFEWVNRKEYREDRERKTYEVKGADWIKQVDLAFSFFAGYVKTTKQKASPEDIRALAVGYVKKCPVVSDDKDIRNVAVAHQVKCWWSFDLLKQMLDHGRIERAKVREVVEYWNNQNDLPMKKSDLRTHYKAIFDEDCPI